MAKMEDTLVGGAMIAVGAIAFSYYNFWALVLPFLDETHPAQAYFLGDNMVVWAPLFLLVTGSTLIGGFFLSVMMKSSKKKKST